MRIVTNKSDSNIEIPYEGWTYTLLADDNRLAEEGIAYFLRERYPFVQVTKPPVGKKLGPSAIPTIERKKTPAYIAPDPRKKAEEEAMRITPAVVKDATYENDGLPQSGSTDKDGVEWVGEGIETDDLTNKRVFH